MKKFYTLLLLATLVPYNVFADDITKKISISEDKPINIKAESMMILSKDNISIFKKNVHVKQEELDMYADQITVYSVYNESLKKNNFEQIVAKGNVRFTHKERAATSSSAIYDVKTDTITLSDGVTLEEKDNNLKGSKFTYNLSTGQSNLAGTVDKANPNKPARVRATLIPGEDADDIFLPVPAIEMLTGGNKVKKQAEQKLGQ